MCNDDDDNIYLYIAIRFNIEWAFEPILFIVVGASSTRPTAIYIIFFF